MSIFDCLWGPLVAPSLLGVSAYCCGIGLICLSAKRDNYRNLNENIGLLEIALDELIAERDKVQTKVNAGELKGGKREAGVNTWLLKVGTIETDTNLLLADQAPSQDDDDAVVDQERSTPGCWSVDSISNCCLGEKVFNKLNEVRDLTCRGQYYWNTKQALPVVEEIEVHDIFGLDMTLTWETLMTNRMVGIYGMGGVGKTTLLALINNKFATAEEVGKYDVVIWVKVSKDANVGNIQDDNKKIQGFVEEIQDTIGERLHLCDENWSKYTKAKKTSEIRKGLKGKPRFVLLLDDLWKEVSLSEIGVPANGDYKIVFTTRFEDVCARMKANAKTKVQFLGESDAWDLFELHAGRSRLNGDILSIAKQIAAKCCGLPLALKVIGKTMASKQTVGQWRRALDKVESSPSELKDTDKDIFEVLKLSFDDLQGTEAKCFLYCALFPKAYNIKRDELVEYWIGEGFIKEGGGRQKTKNRGKDIIDTLVNACLLLKDGESEQKVYMHDIIREMALWIVSEVRDGGERYVVQAGGDLRQLPDVTDCQTVTKMSLMNNQIGGIPSDYVFPNPDRLVTLFLQNNKLVDIVGKFFEVLSTLVVLDLSGNHNITELPKEISMLVALRYLSLLGTMIKDLPQDFGGLTQLIHLDLESTSNLQSISPISRLLKLQVLRFYGSKASLDASLMKHLKSFRKLHVLTITVREADVLEAFLGSELAGKTQGLYLHGLKLSVASFGELGSLRNLKMINCDITESATEWKDKCTPSTSNQVTPNNRWFNKLSVVVLISCQDVRDLTWLMYANNLESLSISNSPNLEEVINKKKAGHVVVEPFPKLQVLDLDYLDELRSIYWRPLSSPELREVPITNCPKLPLSSIWVKNIDGLLIKRS